MNCTVHFLIPIESSLLKQGISYLYYTNNTLLITYKKRLSPLLYEIYYDKSLFWKIVSYEEAKKRNFI